MCAEWMPWDWARFQWKRLEIFEAAYNMARFICHVIVCQQNRPGLYRSLSDIAETGRYFL